MTEGSGSDSLRGRKPTIAERLKAAGLGDLPYIKVTSKAPTPAEERQGNVVAGVRSWNEGLRRASDMADARRRKEQS